MSLWKCLFTVSIIGSLFADTGDFQFEGAYEEYGAHPLDLIAQFLPDNPIIFEAGAHYGEDSVRFAKKWPDSVVYSFEPNPFAFERLVERVQRLGQIKPQKMAIGDQSGFVTFYVCDGMGADAINDGASSLLPPSSFMKEYYRGPEFEVRCSTLDEWCLENSVDGFDFMWLDMEGAELQALMHGKKALTTVKALFVETNFQEFRIGMTQVRELKEFLNLQGFRLLSHWYGEGYQGNALFVREEFFPKELL